jgi:hypothetical protein
LPGMRQIVANVEAPQTPARRDSDAGSSRSFSAPPIVLPAIPVACAHAAIPP